MKPFLLIGLLSSSSIYAQSVPVAGTEAAQPFKGANTILIHTTDSVGPALKKFARAMLLNGLEPDRIDAEIGYLNSKPKRVGSISPATFEYKAVATAEPSGTLLTITGIYIVPLSEARNMTESMFWTKGNLLQAKQCFIGVELAALAYPQGRIGYVLRP